ncbi:SET domain-containing protein [Endozoicomonas sp. SCSIO W0465]|uniref:SET domain-containing protein n=1 Tax=Endozoicomonas sp. SCSIO W0465 TaxID=2918516 RepID=UPI002075443F|nr:SET domain-containing protein [Endozoicomonas sp. SCSIO W0465]USE38409.1 SET domain-containing protein [Endozoicomonas sp. SCSIO W0465]
MQSTGFEFGQIPTLRRFDAADTYTPPAKKPCFQKLDSNTAANNYLPSNCNHCIDDVKTVFDHSMVLLKARNTIIVPGENYSALIKDLSSFKDLITSELDRFTQYDGSTGDNRQETLYSPDSPVSERAATPISPGTEFSARYKSSTEGVVDGTGVIATQNIKAGEVVCPYDGPLMYRILNYHSGKYHVFTIKNITDDGFTVLDFLENDTFVAWSGVFIAKAGRPVIELGRNCEQDIRFLNHSKKANVMIRYTGMNTVEWEDKDSLQLMVVALSDIKPGEELLFDYDKNKPDSEIDFNMSDVEKASEEQRNKIIKRINTLSQKHLHHLPKEQRLSSRKLEKDVILPPKLDDDIGQIIEITEDIRTTNGIPATIDQITEKLSFYQIKLLNIIFSDKASILEDLASHLSPGKTRTSKNTVMDKLTTENIQDLKTYLTRSIFNGNRTWVTVQQLKQHIAAYW